MNDQRFIVCITFLLLVFGCKKKENKHKNTVSVVSIKEALPSLYIEGDDIWVRNAPATGKVIVKLDDKQHCEILDTTKLDTIRGYIDHWYKIKYGNTSGWVFGSQTSIKSMKSKETDMFLKQMNVFIGALRTKDFRTMNSFIPENEPVHCMLASLASDHCRTTITNDLKSLLEFYDFKEFLDTLKVSTFLGNQIKYTQKKNIGDVMIKPGIYYQYLPTGNDDISRYEKWQIDYDMAGDEYWKVLKREYTNYVKREKEVRFKLVIVLYEESEDDVDEYYGYGTFQFFFYLRKSKWYLSGIYHPYF